MSFRKRTWDLVRGGATSVGSAFFMAGLLAWIGVDHVRRRLTGRASMFGEMFEGLDFDLREEDVRKPYDAPGSTPPEKDELGARRGPGGKKRR